MTNCSSAGSRRNDCSSYILVVTRVLLIILIHRGNSRSLHAHIHSRLQNNHLHDMMIDMSMTLKTKLQRNSGCSHQRQLRWPTIQRIHVTSTHKNIMKAHSVSPLHLLLKVQYISGNMSIQICHIQPKRLQFFCKFKI